MPRAPWPTHGGREVYSHHTLAALDQLGYAMGAVFTEASTDTADSWALASRIRIESLAGEDAGSATTSRSRLDARWRRYWGWSAGQLDALHKVVERQQPAFVAAAGLAMLPALACVPAGIPRIWLALDEPFSFQRSLARNAGSLGEKWSRLKLATVFAAYERTYARRIHTAVAVSTADARALRRIGGFKQVLCLPNGVDADYFSPSTTDADPFTAVFWGRLDFEPNIQALRWFARHVWPTVVQRSPHAELRIIGRQSDAQLEQELRTLSGVNWIGPVDDLRPWAHRSSVVVLPIQSGAGIKNKLLEAAAMAKPILASPKAVTGLHADNAWQLVDAPRQWVSGLEALWADPQRGRMLGEHARQWVLRDHSWPANARRLIAHVQGATEAHTIDATTAERRAA